jgi:hypothetical protein
VTEGYYSYYYLVCSDDSCFLFIMPTGGRVQHHLWSKSRCSHSERLRKQSRGHNRSFSSPITNQDSLPNYAYTLATTPIGFSGTGFRNNSLSVIPSFILPLSRSIHYAHNSIHLLDDTSLTLRLQVDDKLDSDEEKEKKHEEAHIFFGWAKAELIKMFDRWIDERLFFLGAFGEHGVAKYIARWMLLENEVQTLLRPGKAEHYTSEFHGAKIDIGELLVFFQEHCAIPEILRNDYYHTQKNLDFIKQIADGLNIWDAESVAAENIRMPTLRDYGGLPSSTQFLERGNKNHNYFAANGREERAIQARMIARSHLIEVTSITTVDGKRDASNHLYAQFLG